MSILFTGREMLETAIEVERNGFSFYSELARAGKARFTFEHLAGQEKRHESLFQGMLDSLGQAPAPESYNGELALYIKTLASGRVFKSPQEAREMAQKLSPEEAVRTAIGIEKDSILFYGEMRGLVRREDRSLVDRIMDEERGHVLQLSEVLSQMGGAN
ncbi:MAG TPA: ferritin family protein [Dehalococcoidia bacterium]|nr:ferritin family protein [Dehalococcoidia bacterium]